MADTLYSEEEEEEEEEALLTWDGPTDLLFGMEFVLRRRRRGRRKRRNRPPPSSSSAKRQICSNKKLRISSSIAGWRVKRDYWCRQLFFLALWWSSGWGGGGKDLEKAAKKRCVRWAKKS